MSWLFLKLGVRMKFKFSKSLSKVINSQETIGTTATKVKKKGYKNREAGSCIFDLILYY